MATLEFYVFDAQSQPLGKAQTSPVPEDSDELGCTLRLADEALNLVPIEDGRQALGTRSEYEMFRNLALAVEDLPVEKDQCRECVILRRSGDLAVNGEVAEEGDHFRLAHIPGSVLVAGRDVTIDSVFLAYREVPTTVVPGVCVVRFGLLTTAYGRPLNDVVPLAERLRSTDDLSGIHWDLRIIPWETGRMHLRCLSLYFLVGFLMLAHCHRVHNQPGSAPRATE